MSAEFDFNASLNAFAPVIPIKLSVHLMKKKRVDYRGMPIALFLSCSPFRSNRVSAEFDFNASLNAFAPVYPILPSVDWMGM